MAHVLYMQTAPSNADTLFPTPRLLPSHIEHIPRNTTSDRSPVFCLSPPRSCSTGSSSADLSITGSFSPVLNPLHTPFPIGNVLVARAEAFLPLITTTFAPWTDFPFTSPCLAPGTGQNDPVCSCSSSQPLRARLSYGSVVVVP